MKLKPLSVEKTNEIVQRFIKNAPKINQNNLKLKLNLKISEENLLYKELLEYQLPNLQ